MPKIKKKINKKGQLTALTFNCPDMDEDTGKLFNWGLTHLWPGIGNADDPKYADLVPTKEDFESVVKSIIDDYKDVQYNYERKPYTFNKKPTHPDKIIKKIKANRDLCYEMYSKGVSRGERRILNKWKPWKVKSSGDSNE